MRPLPRTVRLLAAAAHAGDVPGGVAMVIDEGEVRCAHAFGHRALVPRRAPATLATLYDLASLTKVLCTTGLAMQAVARGDLDLDAPARRLVPELRGRDRRDIRVWHLLAHAAGLPAHRPFYEAHPGRDFARQRAAIFAAAAAAPLEYPTGTRSLYSDLGFLVLGLALERALGDRLDRLFAAAIARPLGLARARFVDLARPGVRAGLLRRHAVAPTQVRRGRARRLAVDDDNAFAMGGVAPHAGLFAPVAEVATLGLAVCRAWHGAGPFDRDVVRHFCTPAAIPDSTRALGWDTPAGRDSSAGTRFPLPAVGHLGYTGTSIWIAPARGLVVVLLTNRVHPTAANTAIRRLRPAFHDAVLLDLAAPRRGRRPQSRADAAPSPARRVDTPRQGR